MIFFRSYFIYISTLCLVLVTMAFKALQTTTDDPVLTGIISKIESFTKENQQEQIFIQTDKTYYSAGDTIWFKGYVRAADSNGPTQLSSILHLSLLQENKQEIQKLRLEITNGLTSGFIALPENAQAGNYTLVAFTRWMRNYPASYSFIKPIPIYNFASDNPGKVAASKPINQLYFFPEGGNLVNGLESKIVLKAVDSLGNLMAITGTLQDNAGNTILNFNSTENGFGSFLFKPEAGKSYTATSKSKNILPVVLPPALASGYVLTANNSNSTTCIVQVQKSGGSLPDKVFLVARSQNKVVFADAQSFSGDATTITWQVSKSNLPEGVVQLTLFAQDGKPYAERLIYVHKQSPLAVVVKPSKNSYNPGEKVDLEVEVKDSNGMGVPANISVSVTDVYAALAPEETYLSYLQLSWQVTDPIQNPMQFFKNISPETKHALDLLLLTEGWRRFSWPEILRGVSTPKQYLPEKDFIFKARATTAEGKPVAATLLNILLMGTGNTYAAFTDPNGDFSVILPDYETTGDAILRFYKGEEALQGIKVTPALESVVNWLPKAASSPLLVNHAVYQQNAYNLYRIQNAYGLLGVGKTNSNLKNQNALYKLGRSGNRSYNMAKYEQFNNMEELFTEVIASVTLKKTKSGLESRLYSGQATKYFANSPLYLIDGKPTFDNQVVLSLPIEQIARVEVFNDAEPLRKFGLMGRDGVIAIYTKSNKLDLQNLSDTVVPFEGLFTNRQFSQPAFKIPKAKEVPAFRPMLYWQADLKTDGNGKVKVNFKNVADITRYKITVEAITQDGLPGVGEGQYEVVKLNK